VRVSDSDTPGHEGIGEIDSEWSAKWRVKVKIIGREAYIVAANAFYLVGTASGEYRGSYPKSDTTTAHFTCRFGPIGPSHVLKHLRIYGVGRTDGKVSVNAGVNGEPGVLPHLKCSGDLIDTGTPKTVSAGVLTGIETVCFGDVPVSGAPLKSRTAFRKKKKFGWHPPTPGASPDPAPGSASRSAAPARAPSG
jgi:hypothetical protein